MVTKKKVKETQDSRETPPETEIDIEDFLDTLTGQDSPTVPIKDANVSIKRATAAELYNIMDLLRTLIKTLGITDVAGIEEAVKTIKDPAMFITLLMDSHDRMFKLVAGLSDMTEEEVMALEIDDLLLLAMAEWRVNERFFTERVILLAKALFPQSPNIKQ